MIDFNKYLTIWVCCQANDVKERYIDKLGENERHYQFINVNNDYEGENIFRLNKFLCEYVMHHYIWKNNLRSDYIGICQEKRLIKTNTLDFNKLSKDDVFQVYIKFHISNFSTNYVLYALQYQQGQKDIEEYINSQNIINIKNIPNVFVQREIYACNWSTFDKIMQFLQGYVDFISSKYNLSDFDSWAAHIEENYIKQINPTTCVYWVMYNYNIYETNKANSLSDGCRVNIWRIYAYIIEYLYSLAILSMDDFIIGKNEDFL